MIYDTHCHLDYFEDPYKIIENSFSSGLIFLNTICVEIAKFEKIYEISKTNKNIYCSIGQHPCHLDEIDLEIFRNKCENYIKDDKSSGFNKIKAIGETGLDYFRVEEDKIKSFQIELFELQIEIANKFNLPVIIHTRSASKDTIEVIKKNRPQKGLIHCFTEDLDFMEKCLELGLYISFSGIVTFKNSKSIQECAKNCSLDRILIETDAPYLSPEPLRGKQNEPKNIIHTAKFIANLRGIDEEEFQRISAKNAVTLFET